jgi:hypothetical protein
MRKNCLYLLLIFICVQSFAADSTGTANANRIGITYSEDWTSNFEARYDGQFGNRIGITYARELDKHWIFGTGLAYSKLGLRSVYTSSSYEQSSQIYINYDTRIEGIFAAHYLELPAYLRANIGEPGRVRFSVRFGLALTAHMQSTVKSTTTHTGVAGVPPNTTYTNTENYKLFSNDEYTKAEIRYSASVAAGTEIKLSEKIVLNLEPEFRFYRRYPHHHFFALGVEVGGYYRF